MLSARTTDLAVNKITPALFHAAPTPAAMLVLGLDAVKQLISTIGLDNIKSKNLLGLSRLIISEHGGEIPTSLDDLMTLPGVGRKTAQVVLNTLYNASYISVDTHVFRVAKRLGLAAGNTPLKVEQSLLKVVPPSHIPKISRRLWLHGRYVCIAINPKCQLCPLVQWCSFYNNNV